MSTGAFDNLDPSLGSLGDTAYDPATDQYYDDETQEDLSPQPKPTEDDSSDGDDGQPMIDADSDVDNSKPVQDWPSAVPIHSEAWVKDPASPSGWSYRCISGTTIAGLAARYMNDPSRFKEIEQFGHNSQLSPSGSFADLALNVLINMPPDAVAGAVKLGAIKSDLPVKNDPGQNPGLNVGLIVAAGVAGVCVLGLVLMVLVRRGK